MGCELGAVSCELRAMSYERVTLSEAKGPKLT
jgi:hypothetical protein